eukprot:GGOE01022560.1.p1 GENE.GGOE01022560.1~~GGOE01022560.1.p1  ORF type:complete len:329 (+),score=71.12 GGOE01022560.1:178-1164(+)
MTLYTFHVVFRELTLGSSIAVPAGSLLKVFWEVEDHRYLRGDFSTTAAPIRAMQIVPFNDHFQFELDVQDPTENCLVNFAVYLGGDTKEDLLDVIPFNIMQCPPSRAPFKARASGKQCTVVFFIFARLPSDDPHTINKIKEEVALCKVRKLALERLHFISGSPRRKKSQSPLPRHLSCLSQGQRSFRSPTSSPLRNAASHRFGRYRSPTSMRSQQLPQEGFEDIPFATSEAGSVDTPREDPAPNLSARTFSAHTLWERRKERRKSLTQREETSDEASSPIERSKNQGKHPEVKLSPQVLPVSTQLGVKPLQTAEDRQCGPMCDACTVS